MICRLSISNVALIEQQDIEFSSGFSVLTGETGAGKSIIIEALNFVLGERASRELIKSGEQKARVEALFSLSENEPVRQELEEQGVEIEDGELTLYREFSLTGKNVCRANGTLISATDLKRIGDLLVDIHGQHAHQSLLDTKKHIALLDQFAGRETLDVRESVRVAYRLASDAKRAYEAAQFDESERARRVDLLAYQIREIDDAHLVVGEDEQLEEQRRLLQNAQTVMESLEGASEALSGDEGGVIGGLSGALKLLESIATFRAEYAELTEKVRGLYYELEDASYTVRDLKSDFSYEPGMLDEIEERLERISALKRKYGASIEDILAFRNASEAELEQLNNVEERRERLKSAYEKEKRAFDDHAVRLSELRKAAAVRLSEMLLPQLADLGMPNSAFEVAFTPLSGELPGANGIDGVEFLLSTNKGEPLKPLSRVASGGELSRIMLSFKSVLAASDGIPSMVFDEIDSGISGMIAASLAVKMRAIARNHQVLCITHLPQIAAFANNQYLVYKEESGERTISHAKLLSSEERVRELARIMGSSPDDAVALEHARKLISNAESVMRRVE